MINLITGLPGASKTLYTISTVKKTAEQDNRPVFYSGITELNTDLLPWTEIDAEKWFECPPGAIVIIDECQRVFRPRTISKDVPDFVAKLETHRHLGIDLYLITQHPMLADSAIRRLTGNHRHIVRRFGMQSSTIHQWDGVKDQVEKPSSRADSNKTVWAFDKSVFNLYKSAELHTVKRSLPKRMLLVLAVPFAIGFAVWSVKSLMFPKKIPAPAVQAGMSGFAPGAAPAAGENFKYKTAVDDAKEYVFQETPRVSELPHTAPKYDKITEPTVAPFPVGCVKTSHSCECFSQQATPIKTSLETCERIVEHGIFEDFDVNGRDSRGSSDSAAVVPPSVSRPAVVADASPVVVTAVPAAPDPVPDVVHVVARKKS